MSDHEKLVHHLMSYSNWTERSARVGIRAGFRCEYCDKELLASPDNYKGWQEDHIIPRSSDGLDEDENIALSCRECNSSFKNRWNPLTTFDHDPTRSELIEAVRQYVQEQRYRTLKEIHGYRERIEEWL